MVEGRFAYVFSVDEFISVQENNVKFKEKF